MLIGQDWATCFSLPEPSGLGSLGQRNHDTKEWILLSQKLIVGYSAQVNVERDPRVCDPKYQQEKTRGAKKNSNPELALVFNAVPMEAAHCPLSMPFVPWADQGFCITLVHSYFQEITRGVMGEGNTPLPV